MINEESAQKRDKNIKTNSSVQPQDLCDTGFIGGKKFFPLNKDLELDQIPIESLDDTGKRTNSSSLEDFEVEYINSVSPEDFEVGRINGYGANHEPRTESFSHAERVLNSRINNQDGFIR